VFEVAVVVALLVGLLARPVGVAGGLGVAVLMAGAVGIRQRAGGEWRRRVPADAVVLLLGVTVAVLGAAA
jgi:hypothetical protein